MNHLPLALLLVLATFASPATAVPIDADATSPLHVAQAELRLCYRTICVEIEDPLCYLPPPLCP